MKKITGYILAFILAFGIFLPGLSYSVNAQTPNLKGTEGDERLGYEILYSLSDEYGYDDPREEFLYEKTVYISYGRTIRFVQLYDGTEIYGRGLNITVDENDEFLSVSGDYEKINRVNKVNYTEEQAAETLTEQYGDCYVTDCKKYVVVEEDKAPAYAYTMTLSLGKQVTISAYDLSIISCAENAAYVQKDTTQTDWFGNEVEMTIEYAESEGVYYLQDDLRNIMVCDARGSRLRSDDKDGKFDDKMAITVLKNVQDSYDFYTDIDMMGTFQNIRYGINGLNNQKYGDGFGASSEYSIQVVMHLYTNWENAAFTPAGFNRGVMQIGDGNPLGTLYHPGVALDIIGHEYQHGISYDIAEFDSVGEPGALNEAFSDMFGALIEAWSYGYDLSDDRFWGLGENGVSDKQVYLRNMKMSTGSNPLNVQNMFKCTRMHQHSADECDNNGVHVNSLIPTHFQYRLYSQMPDVFTAPVITQLWYATLSMLGKTSTFADFGTSYRKAAVGMKLGDDVLEAIDKNLFLSGFTAGANDFLVNYVDVYNDANNRPTKIYLDSIMVKNGDDATAPVDPSREPTKQKAYEFTGWSSDGKNITSDNTEIYANFEEKERKYTVTFVDKETGETIDTVEVSYGESVPVPEKEPDDMYEYTARCDKSTASVQSDMVVNVEWTKIRLYNVKFMDGNDELSSLRKRSGNTLSFPETPTKSGYVFKGWFYDTDFTSEATTSDQVTQDVVLYAKWEKTAAEPGDNDNPGENPGEDPGDPSGGDKDANCSSCAYTTFGGGNWFIPPFIGLIALAILLPIRKKNKNN